MKIQLKKMEERFNRSTLRERIMASFCLFLVSYALWNITVYDYLLATDSEVTSRIELFKNQITGLEKQIDTISGVVGRDPTAQLTRQMEKLKSGSDALSREIVEATKNMVSPAQMNNVLRKVIEKSDGMTLVEMESLARKPLFDEQTIQQVQNEGVSQRTNEFQVFNHGLRLEMLGTYFETLEFLKSVEAEGLNVIWDIVDYEVIKYPKAKILIVVHTLSLDEAWIGV